MIIKKHNKDAYEKIKEGFTRSNRVATICATGTGKSYQALQLIEDNRDKHILYITSLKTIKEQFKTLCKQELSYTIKAITYDSSSDEKVLTQKWDYIIVDEFHRGGAEIWGEKLAQLIECNPNAKILGLSATPIRYLDDMRNMADELFEGNVVYELTLAKAIAEGILPIPEYISCLYSFDGVNQKIASYEEKIKKEKYIKDREKIQRLIKKAKKLVAESPDVKTVLKNNIHDKQGHYIVFCSNINQLESLVLTAGELFSDVNTVTTYSIYSDKKDNKQTLDKFLGDNSKNIKLLFAVNMITEGVHADNISGVVFLRPTASPNVYLQQMGRALSSGKTNKPQIIDMVNNTDCLKMSKDLANEVNGIIQQSYETTTTNMEFSIIDYVKQIEEVLEAVEASLYWGWDDWYAQARKYYENHGSLDMPKNYKTEEGYNLEQWIKTQRKDYRTGRMSADHVRLLEELGIRWDPLQDLWNVGFVHAKDYYNSFGNLLIPSDYVCDDGFALGVWIKNERISYKNGVLSDDNKANLDMIEMVWNVPDKQWNEAFELAKKYYEQFGDLKVPRQYITTSGVRLGMWISDRRRNYKKGMLTDEQIARLESIGMIWDVTADTWDKGYEEAKTFYERNHDLIVPRDYISENGFKLGSWISHMREKYRNNKLGHEQIEKLTQIGMVWDRQSVRTRRKKMDSEKGIIDPFEVNDNHNYIEGATKQITVNAYERDSKARAKCLEYYLKKDGTIKCQICGFDFGAFYGEQCNNMIEVHHMRPLSKVKKEYQIDPINDLIPLCSNCHYVVHAKFDGNVEQLKKYFKDRQKV